MAISVVEQPIVPIGALKQIGDNGPAYEVLEDTSREKPLIRIQIIETGELLEYPRAQVLSDRDAG